jgi:hypothetical protein
MGILKQLGGADPVQPSMLQRSLTCPNTASGVVRRLVISRALFCLLNRCGKRDLALALERAADLAEAGLLVGFHSAQDDAPLLQTPSRNGWLA